MPDDSWFDFTDWTPPPTPKVDRSVELKEPPAPRTAWLKTCYLCDEPPMRGNDYLASRKAYETCDICICDACLHLASPLKW